MEDFFKECSEFDWYFSYSDDARVFNAGSSAQKKLLAKSETSLLFRKIYDAWESYMFSGVPFGTERTKKPELSDFKE